MYFINKITSDHVVDYAAEELKKYLRMMMPEGGDVRISYNPEAKDGFRLGLMQDFGFDVSDVKDTALDDILYIDCDCDGGIIAGDNPRSVLLSVYEYLRQNGCRWLMPTVDGEYIPMKNIEPVKYRFAPSMRYRGWCNEGAEYQQCMFDAIEFAPKVGMNTIMMEFKIPTPYYDRYYGHLYNEENRPSELVTRTQILQWKRQCEAEISKRGLQFHDIGHGWCADSFGIDSSLNEWDGDNEAKIPPESRKFIALVNGERKLFYNTPNYTQCCLSNEEGQDIMVKYICDYAESHSNIDFLHVWLGDGSNNHCECEECQKKTPSDFYMIILNKIDEELTKRNLDTRIVFIAYLDTMWTPLTEKLKNQKRFSLLLAPITRIYTETLPKTKSEIVLRPYERNKLVFPANLEENFAYFEEWKKDWKGANLSYEYHFWHHQFRDPSLLEISKIINSDIKVYKEYGVNGLIEDGSQRSFFPNGFAFYTYARTLFDTTLNYDEILEDYFSHAYGEDWKKFYEYMKEISEVMPYDFLEGERSVDKTKGRFYNPEVAEKLRRVAEVTERGMELIREHYNSDFRVQTLSVRLLEFHARYCNLLAECLVYKAQGQHDKGKELCNAWRIEMGKREAEFQPFFDHTLASYAYLGTFGVFGEKVGEEANVNDAVLA